MNAAMFVMAAYYIRVVLGTSSSASCRVTIGTVAVASECESVRLKGLRGGKEA